MIDCLLNIYATTDRLPFFFNTVHAVSSNQATHDNSQTIHNDKVKARRRSQFPCNATIMQRMFTKCHSGHEQYKSHLHTAVTASAA